MHVLQEERKKNEANAINRTHQNRAQRLCFGFFICLPLLDSQRRRLTSHAHHHPCGSGAAYQWGIGQRRSAARNWTPSASRKGFGKKKNGRWTSRRGYVQWAVLAGHLFLASTDNCTLLEMHLDTFGQIARLQGARVTSTLFIALNVSLLTLWRQIVSHSF